MYSATSRLAIAFFLIGSIGLATSAHAQDSKSSHVDHSMGAAPDFIQQDRPAPDHWNLSSFTPSLVYGMNVAAGGGDFGTFDSALPESFSIVGPVSSADYCGAGGAAPDGSTYYLICGTSLMTVDPETGDVTDVGDLETAEAFAAMAYDTSDDTWYGITNVDCTTDGTLWTLDLETPSATEVGAITDEQCAVGMDFAPDGNLYMYGIVTDSLYTVDTATGTTTNVGDIGFDGNFGQDMYWDSLNETMYMTAFNTGSGQPELRSVDLDTGMSTLEWVLNADQVDATAAPADGVEAPRPEDPTILVSVSEIDFGTVPIGEEADAVEVQLVNVGLNTLNISDISLDDGTGGFTLDLTGTSMMLETDEQTSFLVGFAPEEAGSFMDNVSISSDDPASPATVALAGSGRDASLDEPCVLDAFEVDSPMNGGEPVTLTCEGGVATEGDVTGFHFIGTVAGVSGSISWASDLCMIVEAPDGTTYGVGGITGTNPECAVNDWEFQGGVSTDDGTYESTHNDVFPEVDDAGTWTFTFINDWDSESSATHSWSDVTVTLRKVPSVATEASPEEIAEVLGTPSPNPVHSTATFPIAVEDGQNVTVEVFDVTGRRIQTLYNGVLASGMSETLTLDASVLPAGVYVIRATGEDFTKTQRVTVVR